MKLKKTFVSAVAALALAGGTTGAFADDVEAETTNVPILSCLIPINLALIGEAEQTNCSAASSAEEETSIKVEAKKNHH
ncbi:MULTISPECIES: hypothetical protein [Streptomyces]|uniref:Secreted protein n=1 Tax=Streptomyces lycii TaxID=2654337 RepID=A0ABQ7FPX2_9ACTN|nr:MULTISPECIES: hypothetical protein [Streptomyces]KAF4409283.1 hypothetical protein GCU69_09805 [Streptomyces lycii]PGH49091.1 hypothetical protein CRI70_19585 [Streptomyces sp. Ru87]